MDTSHPFYLAWLELNGVGAPPQTRLPVIARILIGDPNFHPNIVGIAIYRACVDEILGDPDTYDSSELQDWASNQFVEYQKQDKLANFLDGPVLESI
ncbi:MAG: hypothetical protein AAB642_00100 [Patescibacteria group bacterium]